MRRIELSMLGLLVVVGGCGPQATDTGYEPRRLGLSEAQRKALYAPRYSQERAQADSAQGQPGAPSGGRKPGGMGMQLGAAKRIKRMPKARPRRRFRISAMVTRSSAGSSTRSRRIWDVRGKGARAWCGGEPHVGRWPRLDQEPPPLVAGDPYRTVSR